MLKRHVFVLAVEVAIGAIGTVCVAATSHAQNFPSKSLRIIVPFPPGGASDVTARILGE